MRSSQCSVLVGERVTAIKIFACPALSLFLVARAFPTLGLSLFTLLSTVYSCTVQLRIDLRERVLCMICDCVCVVV